MEHAVGERDFLVVGSGAAGLIGAITARLNGLRPLVIEKAAHWGGTTAIAGGVAWVPCNVEMNRDGEPDDPADARRYVLALMGGEAGDRHRAKIDAYIDAAPKMAAMLAEQGFRWHRNAHHPDYYPTYPGARVGRTLESAIYDGRRLGRWLASLRRNPGFIPAMQTDYAGDFVRMKSGVTPFLRSMKTLARHAAWKLMGREPLTLGAGMIANLMEIAQRLDIPVMLETRLVALTRQDASVTGAVVEQAGRQFPIEAPAGVLLAAGGFAHNPELRRKYHRDLDGSLSCASPDDQGDALVAAEEIGADSEFTQYAWWQPAFLMAPGSPVITLGERALPGSILIDRSGRRFMNEAQNYVAGGLRFIEHGAAKDPPWLIFDRRFLGKYVFPGLSNPRTRKAMEGHGYLKSATSLEQLAGQIGIPPASLEGTIANFNKAAREGHDPEFHRGETNYDRYWADPGHLPNPSLGPIEAAPFYALRILAGDIGTNGGVTTDANSRALDRDGRVIQGLYAAGNTSGSPFGAAYPGGGATIGSALTFGYLAARHAARRNDA